MTVRRAIGLIGIAMPIVLVGGGCLFADVPLKNNLSAYYHTPMRDVLVGMLCTLGVFLFCYRGHDRIENWTANFGAVFVLGLALLPVDIASDPTHRFSFAGYAHTVCGGGFFLTTAYYALFHFPKTTGPDNGEPPESHPAERAVLYRLSGAIILLCLAMMGVYLLLPDGWQAWADRHYALLWLEWIAIWSFASAWLIKGQVIFSDLAVHLFSQTQKKLRGSR